MSEFRFKDCKGNHLLVALSDAEKEYKSMFLEDEDLDTPVVEISLEKEYPDKPLDGFLFPRVASFLMSEVESRPDAVYYYTVSFADLPEDHRGKAPQDYRKDLFSGLEQLLMRRDKWPSDLFSISKHVGKGEYETICKIFYRPAQTHVARMIANGIENCK